MLTMDIHLARLLHLLTHRGQLHDLDCAEDVYSIPKAHPTLSKRYVYYPDHLVQLPSSSPGTFGLLRTLHTVLTEPAFRGMVTSLWRWTRTNGDNVSFNSRPGDQSHRSISIAGLKDMSMGEFLLARTGSPDMVNNLASALMHGIWGGDIWKLSALEGTFQGVYIKHQLPLHAEIKSKALVKHSDYFSGSDILMRTPQIVELITKYEETGYLGFRDGFNTLAQKLAWNLQDNPNVTIKRSNSVKHIEYDKKAKQALVTTTYSETYGHDKVISSLYSGTLAKLTGDTLPSLKGSAAVTIQIVNLWYERIQLDQVYPGFGYLIPQSVPVENNPHAALGVIFDSDRDAAAGIDNRPNRGTNITVMLGGHYWDYVDPSSWPSPEDAIAMAKDTVQRQLGIPATEPTRASTKRCRNCIPQHLVGHRDRMAQAHKELSDAFEGTLAVVGGSYTMPGVLPSLQAARDVALAVSGGKYMVDPEIRGNVSGYQLKHVGQTGLGRFVDDNETFGAVIPNELPFRHSNGCTRFNSPVFHQ